MHALIPIGLALVLMQGPPPKPAGVTDGAKMFSSTTVDRVNEELAAIARGTGWNVAIRTVDSLNGKDIKDEATAQAKAANVNGLFVLFAKNDHKYFAVPTPRARRAFSPEFLKAISADLSGAFRANKFDDGLLAMIATIRKFAAAVPSTTEPVGVRDRAKMFSAEAILKADEQLLALNRDTMWQVAIETIDSLGGQTVQDRATKDAAAAKIRGLFVLIAKGDHKVWMVPSKTSGQVFTKEKIATIVSTLESDFRAGKFDQGLLDSVAAIRKAATPDRPIVLGRMGPAGGGRTSTPSTPPNSAKTKENDAESLPMAATTPPPPLTSQTPRDESSQRPPAAPPRDLPAAARRATEPVVSEAKANWPLYAGIGVVAIIVLWVLGKAFSPGRPAAVAPGYAGSPPVAPQPPQPARSYGPPPTPAPPGGFGQPQRPMPPPGYAPQPGYGPGGYAPAPPAQGSGGMGGFVTGALGGLGGAIAGNILYDKFGRPHPEGVPHDQGHVSGPTGYVPPHQQPASPPPTQETYNASDGGGGSWDEPSSAGATGDWAQQGEVGTGAGGDWGAPAAPESGAEGSWAATDDQGGGAGGDWGAPPPEEPPAGSADWGSPAPDEVASGDWSSPPEPEPQADSGGGGDWGGDVAETDPEQGQGGGW